MGVGEQLRAIPQDHHQVRNGQRAPAGEEIRHRGAAHALECGPRAAIREDAALEHARNRGVRDRLEQAHLAQHLHRDRLRVQRASVHDLQDHAARQDHMGAEVGHAGRVGADDDLVGLAVDHVVAHSGSGIHARSSSCTGRASTEASARSRRAAFAICRGPWTTIRPGRGQSASAVMNAQVGWSVASSRSRARPPARSRRTTPSCR